MANKVQVLFICTGNSARSQISEWYEHTYVVKSVTLIFMENEPSTIFLTISLIMTLFMNGTIS